MRALAVSGTEGLGGEFTFLTDEHFHASFGLFELFAAGLAETHAAFEELERSLQSELARFQLIDYLFQLFEALSKDSRGRAPASFSAIGSF